MINKYNQTYLPGEYPQEKRTIFNKQPLNRNGVDSKIYDYELNIQLYASVYEYFTKLVSLGIFQNTLAAGF